MAKLSEEMALSLLSSGNVMIYSGANLKKPANDNGAENVIQYH